MLRSVEPSIANAVVRAQVYSDADTVEVVGRFTTYVRVLPQNSLVNAVARDVIPIPTTFTSQSLPQDTNVAGDTLQRTGAPLPGHGK